ncbi:MAG: ECF transporter S component [Clostridiales bacterium]|nr:ECF transporter S component [Clostridiales bacterium]
MKGVIKIKNKTKWLVYTALMTAITAVAAMVVAIPSTDSGYTNLSDAIIFMTAVMMDPIAALIAGGFGTFLADLILGSSHTMFFSLAIHGIEGLVVGLLIRLIPRKESKLQYFLDSVYMLIGGVIMVVGYYLAKAFIYGTPATALVSMVRNIIQAASSIVVANLLLYPLKIKRLVNRTDLYGESPQVAVSSEPHSENGQ